MVKQIIYEIVLSKLLLKERVDYKTFIYDSTVI